VRLPTAPLAIGLLALVAGRIVVTLLPANVLDVGTASALGAHRILDGQSIYYPTLGHPDAYGPLAYLVHVPFMALSSGTSWAYLLPVREATIVFDLLTIARADRDARRDRSRNRASQRHREGAGVGC
jgi:hypothetical protein